MERFVRFWVAWVIGFGLALGLSTTFPNLSGAEAQPSPQALVQAGKAAYDAQQFADAYGQLQQASDDFAAVGDRLGQAQALGFQSLALQKLGQWDTAQLALDQSFAILDGLASPPARILAQIFNTQGQLYLSTGQSEQALAAWERAEAAYRAAADTDSALGSQINQVQAMQAIGLYRRAGQTLEAIAAQLATQPPSPIKAKGLLSFGNLLRLRGELDESRRVLAEGLALARQLDLPEETAQFHLSLGNTERAAATLAESLNDGATAIAARQAAIDQYQTAVQVAPSVFTQSQAALNQFSLLIKGERWAIAQTQVSEIQTLLSALPASRAAVYAQVNFAHSLMAFDRAPTADAAQIDTAQVPQLLQTAIAQAEAIQDDRAMAYAIGTLGTWYEQQQDWSTAKALTASALQTAQGIRAPDIAYQWQWQMGRLFQSEAEAKYRASSATPGPSLPPADPQAIRYYSVTVETLDALRSDLVALNPDIQFSFRESVEPVYRDLVDLLLRDENPTPQALDQAREVIESLQLAELDNFFRDACLVATPVEIDQIDANAFVVYPILLKDRLEIIASAPGQPLQHTAVPVSLDQLSQTLETLSEAISLRSSNNRAQTARGVAIVITQAEAETRRLDPLPPAQQIYDWLIRPIEAEIEAANPDALIFVLDGVLRNVPMAVLHDGERYLIEKHAIALTPGLQLLEPRPLAEQELQALVAGLSQARDNFTALPNVEREVAAIQTQVAGQVLLNESFSKDNFAAQLTESSFPVVHLATHGQFSSDPEQTFILAWDDRIRATEFGRLLQQGELQRDEAVELLVLSACETAAGDDRAALGLAGIAVRSGARSTIATLWLVDDEGTSVLTEKLYQQLNDPTINRAEVLRQAQLQLLQDEKYSHPYFWAPFVLIGNWL